jgi:hypothetical protein
METNINIIISEYSEYTGPRYCDQGDKSGEDFYHKELNSAMFNAINQDTKLIVNLDGTAGYLSSFLDESFGNLVFDFTLEIVRKRVKIISFEEPDWIIMIENEVYEDWEERRINNDIPKKTESHKEWYRWVNNKLSKRVWI